MTGYRQDLTVGDGLSNGSVLKLWLTRTLNVGGFDFELFVLMYCVHHGRRHSEEHHDGSFAGVSAFSAWNLQRVGTLLGASRFATVVLADPYVRYSRVASSLGI
jgi:hypothetical protein